MGYHHTKTLGLKAQMWKAAQTLPFRQEHFATNELQMFNVLSANTFNHAAKLHVRGSCVFVNGHQTSAQEFCPFCDAINEPSSWHKRGVRAPWRSTVWDQTKLTLASRGQVFLADGTRSTKLKWIAKIWEIPHMQFKYIKADAMHVLSSYNLFVSRCSGREVLSVSSHQIQFCSRLRWKAIMAILSEGGGRGNLDAKRSSE